MNTLLAPDGQTIALVQVKEELIGFQIHSTKGQAVSYRSDLLIEDGGFDSYRVVQSETRLELEVKAFNDKGTQYIYFLRWKEGEFEWIYTNEPEEAQIAAAEAALLERLWPEQAILLLKPLAEADWSERPRALYLLSLAYEMAGEDARAVETYWRLWHEQPESAYALMARAKIEQYKHE